MPDWWHFWQIVLVAAAPVSELRGAIPLALYYEIDPLVAYVLSVAGNMLPIPFLILGLGWFVNFFSRWSWSKKIIRWWFDRVQRRNQALIEKWGPFALVIFVAIPLPMTGAWSGALLAYLFKMPFRPALGYIGLGVLIAGLLVLGAALGLISWLKL